MQCQRDAERERESNLFRFGSRNSTLDCKVVFALPLPRSQSPVTLPFYPIFCLFRFWGFRPYSVNASCVSQVGQGRQSADKQSVSEMWNEEQPTRRAAATAKQCNFPKFHHPTICNIQVSLRHEQELSWRLAFHFNCSTFFFVLFVFAQRIFNSSFRIWKLTKR